MSLFFLLAAVLVIVVLMLLLPSLARRQQPADGVDRRAVNVSIARAQLTELEKKVSDGELPNEEFQAERLRIEKDLASDLAPAQSESSSRGSWMVWPVAAVVPVMAGVMYLSVGTPDAIDPANRVAMVTQPPQQQAPGDEPAPDLREVVKRIKERLEEQPEDVTGWFMLGRAHMALGEFAPAASAIRKSYELGGENPEVMIRLADALAMSQGGSMAGEPEPLLMRALELQPDNPQGLWLLGMAQSERGDNAAAIQTWQTLMPLLQGDERSQQEITQLMAQAKQELADGEPAVGAAPVAPESVMQPSSASAKLTVEVSLKDGLADDLPADTIVFVYAKAAEGPPMPLAVARKTLADIPFTVILSDEDAMIPAMKISAFDKLIVGARLSLDGNAIAKTGDIFGEVNDVVTGGSEPLQVEITTIKP